jgi:propionyl-CoA carboxylase alpha chain
VRHRPIRRLFVANRGEIARRIIRSAHAMGIVTAVAYAERDGATPFVSEAGTAVELVGTGVAETYLDQAQMIEAARRTGCDAVHPGYGFLSESPSFAKAVEESGLVFVGPSPDAIGALGDKLRARKEARALGVPVLGTDEGGAGTPASFPVIVKAAAGGGGKGMQVARDAAELTGALEAGRRQAKAAFGDGRVFVEPYLDRARHVEVQVLGDCAGAIVHCFERECSIQRRHQKVIEEAPSAAVTPELREQLGEAALRIAAAFSYENAGTVEFLLDEDGRYYFLEVNTRLQVEHPVTEAVTGLDLVREQLLIAEGAPLSFQQGDLSLDGHAIEARLYAEDVEAGYLPAAGRVEIFRRAAEPHVRYDSGVESGTVVGVEYDPLLAKVIAHAPTRRSAAGKLALALARSAAFGITTNRELLIAVLRDEAFLAGETPTSFLEERRLPARIDLGPDGLHVAAVLAALEAERQTRERARVLISLPSGWRMSAMPPERRRFRVGSTVLSVDYRATGEGSYELAVASEQRGGDEERHRLTWHRASRTGASAAIDGSRGPADVAIDGSRRPAAVAIDGMRWPAEVDRVGERIFVGFDSGAAVELVEVPRFSAAGVARPPGALVAPMPGTVISLHVEVGDEVDAGQLLVVVEAMKMEHRITAPFPGHVRELHAAEGRQVAGGELLVGLEPAGASSSPSGAEEG